MSRPLPPEFWPGLRAPRGPRRTRPGHIAICLLLIAAAAAPPLQAQGRGNTAADSDLFSPVADGPGIQARVGHIGFETFGRNSSISHVELFPYLLDDNQMFFSDARLFLTNHARVGGNLGIGYRIRPWGGAHIFGGSLWYDADDSIGELYQDVGISLESYGELFDLRLNGYVPVGNSERLTADRLINPRFVDNSLLYDRLLIYGTALAGVDYEFGVPLPTTFLRQHNLRFYLGAYHFGADGVDAIHGLKTRVEGAIVPSLEAQLALTSDATFGTNVTLGVSWTYFGRFKRTETSRALRYDRMGEFVYRNYNVIVGKRREITSGLEAINPLTGLPYVIQHVGPGGNSSGAPDDPWASIADAQAAGGDVIIVHAGTILNEAVVLNPGDVLLGQGTGIVHHLAVKGYGAVAVPTAGAAGNAPIIQGVSGNAVTLADDSVFAGFVIDAPSGHGIAGFGVKDALVNHVTVNNAGDDGLFLQNSSGKLAFLNVQLHDAAGAALHVSGGSADVRFTGSIDTATGRSVHIQNTSDGRVDLTGATIFEDGGDGLLLVDNDGDVILDNVTVNNASGVGIEIRGGKGGVSLLHKTTLANAANTALLITDRNGNTLVNAAEINAADGKTGVEVADNDGETWLNRLDVNAKNATAVKADDSGRFTVGGGTIASQGGPALDLENTELNMVLTSVSSSGGPFGIRIVDANGTFVITGGAALGSGGKIENATTGILLENVATVGLKGIDLKQNGVGLAAEFVDRLALTNFRVTDSTSHALELYNVGEFHSINGQYLNNGSFDASIVYEVDRAGSYVFSMSSNTVTANVGDAIRIENLAGGAGASLNFSFQGNAITTNAGFARAVLLDWNGILLANAISNGIQTKGTNSTGFHFTTRGASLVQMSFGNNVMLMDGTQNTALFVNTLGPADLVVGGNQIAFNGTGGLGLDLSLAQSADVAILSNRIVDQKGGATGMLFRSLDGPSLINLEQNTIDLRGTGALVDRGIIFESIIDTITLKGSRNNAVLNATTPFFVPAGTTQGKINVNGQMVPQ